MKKQNTLLNAFTRNNCGQYLKIEEFEELTTQERTHPPLVSPKNGSKQPMKH